MVKLYRCNHCGNIVEMVKDAGVNPVCCGENMQLLKANSTDAATEKHVPVVEIEGNVAKVLVGSVTHPMTEDHHIAYIFLETNLGVHRANLNVTGAPEATFLLAEGEKAVAAYEYCNLHGFWVKEL